MKIVILMLSIFLCGCSEKRTASTKEFDLIYEGDIDKIELQRGIIERKYVNGVKAFKLEFTEKQKAVLLDFVLKKRINRIERNSLLKDCDVQILPQSRQKVVIKTADEPLVTLEWTTNNCSESINDLDHLIEMMYSMINDSNRQIEQTDITVE